MKPSRITLGVFLLVVSFSVPAFAQDSDEWLTDFSKRTVSLDELIAGGPSRDGIPPIDEPRFESVAEADKWLSKREPVAIVEMNGAVKAYPLQILIWHEIVNDQVGTVPVVVTFCPLCNTALAFDRRFDGQVLDFGTTGYLRHSDLIMYDRQTETWWQQATGEGIAGLYAGERLDFVGSPVVSWDMFKQQYPTGRVLSRDTGFPDYAERYGRNPYVGYDEPGSSPWAFFRARRDNRLQAKERVVAIEFSGETRAYPYSGLREKRVINDRAGGVDIVVFWTHGTASALDSERISKGRDVGTAGVFERAIETEALTFEPAETGLFRDKETGSIWNVLGHAVSGPLAGQRLVPVHHGTHFWFAWAVFRPGTRVIR